METATDTLRVMLAGLGGYGHFYLNCLLDEPDPGCRLVAGVEPHPDACRRLGELREQQIGIYDSLEAAYAGSGPFDLVILASPIHMHCPQTVATVERGSHVLCEKPLAPTVQAGDEMQAAAERAGRVLGIGYQWSFSEGIQGLKNDICRGDFGAPRRLRTMALWPRPQTYYARNDWAGARKTLDGDWVLDSPVNNACAHFLHNMFFVLGDEPHTSAAPADVRGELYRAKPITNYDTAMLRSHTTAGVEILFLVSHSVREQYGPEFIFEFEQADVRFTAGDSEIRAEFGNGDVRTYPSPEHDRFRKIRNIVDCIVNGGVPLCGVPAALSQTKCMNGLQESVDDIAEFPGELVKTTRREDGDLLHVDGLEEAIRDCFRRGALPSETGYPWAHEGRLVDLRHYRRFPSGG